MADITEAELIPNPDLLFCRVHRAHFNFKENRISRIVFSKPNQSADWSKYSTPADTVNRHKNPPDIRGVAYITAEACRGQEQEVVHFPLKEGDEGGPNLAHSEIRGPKTKEIQTRLRDAVSHVWENPVFRA